MSNNYLGAWKVVDLHNKYVKADFSRWIKVELFSVQWWILVVIFIISWLVWIKLCNNEKLLEIALVGTISMIVTLVLDLFGSDLNFWFYPTQLISFTTCNFGFDFSIVPIGFMLLYQYNERWKSYIITLLMIAVLFAFIGEPLVNKLQLVHYIKWKYVYSFVFYIVTGISIKGLIHRLKRSYKA